MKSILFVIILSIFSFSQEIDKNILLHNIEVQIEENQKLIIENTKIIKNNSLFLKGTNSKKELEEIYKLSFFENKSLIFIFAFLGLLIFMIFGIIKNKEIANLDKEMKDKYQRLEDLTYTKISVLYEENKKYLEAIHKDNNDKDKLRTEQLELFKTRLTNIFTDLTDANVNKYKKSLQKALNESANIYVKDFVNDINGQLKTKKIQEITEKIDSLEKIILENCSKKASSGSIPSPTTKSLIEGDLQKQIQDLNFDSGEKNA